MLPWSLDQPGLQSGFEPKVVAPEVDFLSVHIYPESKKTGESVDLLNGFNVGKPVVIEETFPMHCTVDELRDFLRQSEAHSAGWIGFYWGKTLDECRESGTWADTLMVAWLEMFRELVGKP